MSQQEQKQNRVTKDKQGKLIIKPKQQAKQQATKQRSNQQENLLSASVQSNGQSKRTEQENQNQKQASNESIQNYKDFKKAVQNNIKKTLNFHQLLEQINQYQITSHLKIIIPFKIDTMNCLRDSQLSRTFRCSLIDKMFQFSIYSQFLYYKDKLNAKKSNYLPSKHELKLYNQFFGEAENLFIKSIQNKNKDNKDNLKVAKDQNQANNKKLSASSSQFKSQESDQQQEILSIFRPHKFNEIKNELKCKIINLRQNEPKYYDDQILMKIIYQLRYFYMQKNFITPKELFQSSNSLKGNSQFKFASFKLYSKFKSGKSKQQNNKVTKQNQTTNASQNKPLQNKQQVKTTPDNSKLEGQTINMSENNEKKKQNKQNNNGIEANKENDELEYKYQIEQFQYSQTQNSYVNQCMLKFSNYIQNNLPKQKENKKSNQNKSQVESNRNQYLYLINQYYYGHTLRELIQTNWLGFQSQNIVNRLIKKLFWTILQLEVSGFQYYVPTLDNIIIDDNPTCSDLNINMLSALGTTFLYSQKPIQVKFLDAIKRIPFIWKDQFKIYKNSNQNVGQSPQKANTQIKRKINSNRIKHFLGILVFILCRRIADFEPIKVCAKIKEYLDKKLKQLEALQPKQPIELAKNLEVQIIIKKQQELKQPEDKQMQVQIQKRQYDIKELDKKRKQFQLQKKQHLLNVNKLEALNKSINLQSNVDKDSLFQVLQCVPQLYKNYLKRSDKKGALKNYQKIQQQNSNPSRINKFQAFLGLQKDKLLNLLETGLTKNIAEEDNKQNITWGQLFRMLFLSDKKIQIQSQSLLKLLCEFYEYPKQVQNNQNQNWIGPQLYFALKFNINTEYFCQTFENRWYKCFQIGNCKSIIPYNIQVMSLLNNIKQQVIQTKLKTVRLLIKYYDQNRLMPIKLNQMESQFKHNASLSAKQLNQIKLKYINYVLKQKLLTKQAEQFLKSHQIIKPSQIKQVQTQIKKQQENNTLKLGINTKISESNNNIQVSNNKFQESDKSIQQNNTNIQKDNANIQKKSNTHMPESKTIEYDESISKQWLKQQINKKIQINNSKIILLKQKQQVSHSLFEYLQNYERRVYAKEIIKNEEWEQKIIKTQKNEEVQNNQRVKNQNKQEKNQASDQYKQPTYYLSEDYFKGSIANQLKNQKRHNSDLASLNNKNIQQTQGN